MRRPQRQETLFKVPDPQNHTRADAEYYELIINALAANGERRYAVCIFHGYWARVKS